jgi:hypothetical protein
VPRYSAGLNFVKKEISRRQFLIYSTTATAAAHAWKPLIAYGADANATSLPSTLLLSTSHGLANIARSRAAYQSSSVDEDHTAHLATDGSEATCWECKAGGEQWISVDLGEAVPVSGVTLRWGANFISAYRIQASEESVRPTHWTTVYETTNGIGNVEEIPLRAASARHIRLVGMAGDERGFVISEFEVWSARTIRPAHVPEPVVTRAGALITAGWSLESAMFTTTAAESISSAAWTGADWLPAVVPGTVLASYLAAGAIPDPFFGSQQSQISEDFFTNHDFWYRNTFTVPTDCKGRRLWLVFEGINWKADVYLNGSKLGEIDGAFIRGRFDVTEAAVCGGANCVAVLVRKVAHPGQVQDKRLGGHYRNGGVLGLDSPTFVASIGWNWVPTIRGRNTGIWNHVRFETSGDVVLVDPWVTTELSRPDDSKPGVTRADLTVRAEIRNVSDQPKRCVLCLSMEPITFRKEIALGPHETLAVAIDKAECAALAIENPRLWWPNGYGEPTLHTMTLRVQCDGHESDEKSVSFGIRQMEYRTDNGILQIYVNGHRILCRGGNWGMEDGMLACDAEGYDLRVRMHRDMNLVMIRNWVGMVGRDEFYTACDHHGILVWDDFWLANPGDGPDPSDHAMFMSNAADKVRRVRHHPSLALYCGRNEGDPPPDLDAGLRNAVTTLDGTRYYIPTSASGLVTGHGPYDNQDPAWYFEHRGVTFHSEQGIVCVPPVESMRAMMPEKDLWPISDMWAIHDYQEPRSALYTKRIADRYGAATGLEDYCRKAQLVNLESAKAMYECLQSRQGAGLLVWMTQSAWPALICQLYDYYFEQTAAYFGAKTGCEPLHILWDQYSNLVKVANNTIRDRKGMRAEASVYDLSGGERWRREIALDVAATSASEGFPVEVPDAIGAVFFVRLRLRQADAVLSENFYWSAAANGDCTALNTLPRVSVASSARLVAEGNKRIVTAKVSNPTASIALAVRLMAVRGVCGERVLPAMYEDNYFSLLPKESKIVKISFEEAALGGEMPRLRIEGWNVEPDEVRIFQAGE